MKDLCLVFVDITEKKVFNNLLEEYQKEILKLKEVDEYKYFDSYWQESGRYPYFIKVDNVIA